MNCSNNIFNSNLLLHGLILVVIVIIGQHRVISIDCVEYDVEDKKHVLCEAQQGIRQKIPHDIPVETNILIFRQQSIKFIPSDAFIKLTQLESLTLDSCNIEMVHVNAFTALANLKRLSLRNNSLTMGIDGLPERVFEKLARLEELDLSLNPLGTVSWLNFEGLRFNENFKRLNMSNGKLVLTPKLFLSMYSLQVIDLSYTGLTTIEHETEIVQMKSLREFLLEGNPLICDCRLGWLKRLVMASDGRLMTHREGSLSWRRPNPVTCSQPEMNRGRFAFTGIDETDTENVLDEASFGCPPVMLTNSTSLNVYTLSDVSLFCNITSESNGTSKWFKDDSEILTDNNEKYSISEHQYENYFRAILNISQISLDDAGVYKCEFTNEFGRSFAEFNASITPRLYASIYSSQTVLLITLAISILLICLAVSTIMLFLFRFRQTCSMTMGNPFKGKKGFCVEIGQTDNNNRKDSVSQLTTNENGMNESDNFLKTTTEANLSAGLLSPVMKSGQSFLVSPKLNDCLYVSCDGPEPRVYLNSDSIDSQKSPSKKKLVISEKKATSSLYATVDNTGKTRKPPCPLHGEKMTKPCPVHGDSQKVKTTTNEEEEEGGSTPVKLKSSLKSPRSVNSYSSSGTASLLPSVTSRSHYRAKIGDSVSVMKTNGVIFKSITEFSSSSCCQEEEDEFSPISSDNNMINKTASSLTDSTESLAEKKSVKDYEFYLDRLSKHSQVSLLATNNNHLGSSVNSLRRRSSINNVNFKPNLYPVDKDGQLTMWIGGSRPPSSCLIGTEIIIKDPINQTTGKSMGSSELKRAYSNMSLPKTKGIHNSVMIRAGSKHKLDDPYESDHSSIECN